jgi:arginine decarboxylase
MDLLPKKIFFTKGAGKDSTQLGAFEQALRDAGIEKFNLVRVSSIIPPNCKIITKEEGLKNLKAGSIVFLVLSRIESNEPNRLITASIGAAIPKNKNNYGYLSEYEAFGENSEIGGRKAEEIAARMLLTALGIKLDQNLDCDEVFNMSKKIAKTRNITQSAVVGKDGKWTCAIAAAVFVFK